MWNPDLYRQYASERSRPFFELVARIGADDPAVVADLGCGSGELTASLAERWTGASVQGIDNSPEMIAAAQRMLDQPGRADLAGRLSFALGDVVSWRPDRPVDVIVSNAVLQWVPDHLDVLRGWAVQLAPGGWLAMAVPGNFDQPSHLLMRDLAQSARWASDLGGVQLNRQSADPAVYLDCLAGVGLDVDAWETTCVHLLTGEDPVLRWYQSTGLRPILGTLDQARGEKFLAEYGALLREAYPARSYGTPFPFRRVFAVAHRPALFLPQPALGFGGQPRLGV